MHEGQGREQSRYDSRIQQNEKKSIFYSDFLRIDFCGVEAIAKEYASFWVFFCKLEAFSTYFIDQELSI